MLFLQDMLMELFEELSSSAKVGCQEGAFPTEDVSRPVVSLHKPLDLVASLFFFFNFKYSHINPKANKKVTSLKS